MHEIEEIDINDLQTKKFLYFHRSSKNERTLEAFFSPLYFFMLMCIEKGCPFNQNKKKIKNEEGKTFSFFFNYLPKNSLFFCWYLRSENKLRTIFFLFYYFTEGQFINDVI